MCIEVAQDEISGSEEYRGLHLPAGHEAESG